MKLDCCKIFLFKVGKDTLADDARVKGNGVAVHVSYWWLPGSNQTVDSSISSVSCGDPGIPAFGSSLFQSLKAGSLVVHSCNQGYKLVGAKLRLCQSNGQWTPEIPSCVCECYCLTLHRRGPKPYLILYISTYFRCGLRRSWDAIPRISPD